MTDLRHWGTTPQERAEPLPCDALLPDAAIVAHRAVDVAAPVAVAWRWLCQLRAAPYSYDKLDNFASRSPQRLTPGLDALEAGQVVMRVFRLRSFEQGRHLTLDHHGPMGRVVVTYATTPSGAGARYLMRLRWTPPGPRLLQHVLDPALVAGDWVMARRQLLNLRDLAERDAARR